MSGASQSSATRPVPSAPGATNPGSAPPVSLRPTTTSRPAPTLPAAPRMPSAPKAAPQRHVNEGRDAEAARSRSPITDALRDLKADSGDDDLSEMAAGEDDELARMAAGGGPTLSEQIDAQLSGATINYVGDRPEIVPNPDAPTPAEVVERPAQAAAAPKDLQPPVTRAAQTATIPPGTAPVRPTPARTRMRNDEINPPIAWVDTDRDGRVIGKRAGSPPSTQAAKNVPWAVLGVAGCILFSMLSRAGATGALLIIVIFALMVGWFVMRMAGMTGRKTTTMPWDTNAKRGRDRRR
jgi:hypothetical protein